MRAFGGFEKGSEYYFHNHFFMARMGLLALILLLELKPMDTLIQWRIQLGKGKHPSTDPARPMATISIVQA